MRFRMTVAPANASPTIAYQLNANAHHSESPSDCAAVAAAADISEFFESVLSSTIPMCCCAVALDFGRWETLAMPDYLHLRSKWHQLTFILRQFSAAQKMIGTYLDAKLSVLCCDWHRTTNTVWNDWHSTGMPIQLKITHSADQTFRLESLNVTGLE